MKFYWLVLGILCVWRVTHLLNAEDGPWRLLVHLRRCLGTSLWGDLLDCFYCLSLWVAAPFSLLLGQGWKERLLLWPALSGAAILLERATARPETPGSTPTYYVEDEEKHDVLWQGETTTDGTVAAEKQQQNTPHRAGR
jgi:hypothetical protein